jgi:hypothetical protein
MIGRGVWQPADPNFLANNWTKTAIPVWLAIFERGAILSGPVGAFLAVLSHTCSVRFPPHDDEFAEFLFFMIIPRLLDSMLSKPDLAHKMVALAIQLCNARIHQDRYDYTPALFYLLDRSRDLARGSVGSMIATLHRPEIVVGQHEVGLRVILAVMLGHDVFPNLCRSILRAPDFSLVGQVVRFMERTMPYFADWFIEEGLLRYFDDHRFDDGDPRFASPASIPVTSWLVRMARGGASLGFWARLHLSTVANFLFDEDKAIRDRAIDGFGQVLDLPDLEQETLSQLAGHFDGILAVRENSHNGIVMKMIMTLFSGRYITGESLLERIIGTELLLECFPLVSNSVTKEIVEQIIGTGELSRETCTFLLKVFAHRGVRLFARAR